MGLAATIDSKIKAAFDSKLSDAVKQISYVEIVSQYEPISGENFYAEILHSTRGVVGSSDKAEMPNEAIKPFDIEVLILQSELDITPKIDDYLEINGSKFKIGKVQQDPADVTWTLKCLL